MEKFTRIEEISKYIQTLKKSGKKIGFVPTMGCLHEGNLSLIREAKKKSDIIAVSIFVNPAQFGPKEDYKKYPRDLIKDIKLLEKEKVDILFYPSVDEMYGKSGNNTEIKVPILSEKLCGKFRPGHFNGVTTVVAKLFNIIQPDFAYFGKKDYQQCVIIKKMVKDLNIPVEIIGCSLIREKDGLARSSRNKYLSDEERKDALILYKSLNEAIPMIKEGQNKASIIINKIKKMINGIESAKIDYVDIVNPDTLESVRVIKNKDVIVMAVWIGKTRLIDNMEVGDKILEHIPTCRDPATLL